MAINSVLKLVSKTTVVEAGNPQAAVPSQQISPVFASWRYSQYLWSSVLCGIVVLVMWILSQFRPK